MTGVQTCALPIYCIGYWDFNNRDTSHICLQIKDVSIVAKMIDEYKKPLMVDECCYEGDLTHEWGNISGFEMVDRFWRTVVQGGYCTHGETYENEEEILWWSKGGRLRGESPIRITFLKKIVESFPGPLVYCGEEFTKEKYEELCAHPEKIENDFWRSVTRAPWWRAKEALLPGKEYVGHVSEEIYLRYMERKCANKTILNLPLTFLYDVYLLDVWEMTQEKVLESVNGYTEVMLPSKEGMAVLARAKRSIDK